MIDNCNIGARTTGTCQDVGRYRHMLNQIPPRIFALRRLAVQMRGHAADTTMAIYQRKFEGIARDLEDAARDAESWQEVRPKLAS